MSLTTENLAEANVTDWYRELEQAFHANSLGKNTSFMTWFAQKMWGDSDFLCTCTLFEILFHLQLLYPLMDYTILLDSPTNHLFYAILQIIFDICRNQTNE